MSSYPSGYYSSHYDGYSVVNFISILSFGSVITFLLIIIMIVVCCICCRRDNHRDNVVFYPMGQMQPAPVQYTHGPPCQQYQPCHPPPHMYGNRPETIAAPPINPVSGTEFGRAAP